MAQHGYIRDFDEGSDRDDERERWRGRDEDWNQRGRDRGLMFGDRDRGRDDDRGFFDRMGDRARDYFRDDDSEARGGSRDWRGGGERSGPSGRSRSAFSSGGDWDRSGRNFSSRQDDHYRSWRDKQMEALDRDYEDYCREREQQFHSDFDTWRSQRSRSNQQPLRTGMTQSAEEVMDLSDEVSQGHTGETSTPMGAATMGTNSSDTGTSSGGRR
jgi:hypothetical protein